MFMYLYIVSKIFSHSTEMQKSKEAIGTERRMVDRPMIRPHPSLLPWVTSSSLEMKKIPLFMRKVGKQGKERRNKKVKVEKRVKRREDQDTKRRGDL